jgi:hypothetical protein
MEIKNKIAKHKKKVEDENKPKLVPTYVRVSRIWQFLKILLSVYLQEYYFDACKVRPWFFGKDVLFEANGYY